MANKYYFKYTKPKTLLFYARLQNGCPNNKIIFGIPTFGRAWKMDDDSGLTGVPPLPIDGPAEAGPYTNEAGLLSYPEICTKIATPNEVQAGYLGKLRKINDPTKRYGMYKYYLENSTFCTSGEHNFFYSYIYLY